MPREQLGEVRTIVNLGQMWTCTDDYIEVNWAAPDFPGEKGEIAVHVNSNNPFFLDLDDRDKLVELLTTLL